MIGSVVLLIVLIFLNAVFASAEIAVISVSGAKLDRMAEKGDRRAVKLTRLTEQPARFLATIQVAITLAGFLQSAFAADTFAEPLVDFMVRGGVTIPVNILETVCIVVITVVLAYFNLVLGELVPKRLAMKRSESMALKMSGMLYGVSKIFAPIVWLLTASTNGILRLIGIDPEEEEEQVTEEEIKLLLSEGSEQGNILPEETDFIENVFEFNDISAEEICTHRRDVIFLSTEDSDEVWKDTIYHHRHTFYPVCGESADEVSAILDSKDYFRLTDRSRESLMKNAAEPPFFVPETMRADVLFREMREKKTYFAVVIDEYGGMTGIITLRDLIEALVGDLWEEDRDNTPDITEIGENLWRIRGTALLREVSSEIGAELSDEDYDTFNGYVCGLIGRVPKNGETFKCETDELSIEVTEVKNHTAAESLVSRKK